MSITEATKKYFIYKIFKTAITPDEANNFYIGSTNNITKRGQSHKHACKTSNRKLYIYIRENGGWDNFTMAAIAEYECTRAEALLYENDHIITHRPNLNCISAALTEEQKRIMRRKHHMTAFAKKYLCSCGGRFDGLHAHMHNKTKMHNIFIGGGGIPSFELIAA